MVDRYLLVRKDGQAAQIPAGDAIRLRGVLRHAAPMPGGVDASNYLPVDDVSSNTIQVTSAVNIERLTGGRQGERRTLMFTADGAVLVRSLYLVLVGSTGNIATAAGDSCEFIKTSSSENVWTMLSYTRASGAALVGAPDATKLPLDGSKQMTGGLNEAPIVPVTLTGTGISVLNLQSAGPANTYTVTATQGAKGINEIYARAGVGAKRTLVFGTQTQGQITLYQTFGLLLTPNAMEIVVREGDTCELLCTVGSTDGSVATEVWRIISYTRFDGTALVASAGSDATKLPLNGSVQMTGQLREAPMVTDLVAASAMNLQNLTTNYVQINGATSAVTINTLGDAPSGLDLDVIFGNVFNGLTLAHSDGTGIRLPGAANITVSIYDTARFRSRGNNAWDCQFYQKRNGQALVASSQGQVFRSETIQATVVNQTSFTVPNGYTSGSILVWLNGALLQPAEYTATTGTTVVLTVGTTSAQDVMQVGVLSAIRAQDDALLQSTVADLPAASTSLAKIRYCTNMAGRAGPVYSDGTSWRRFVDDSVVTA
jgi:hypothetical protein